MNEKNLAPQDNNERLEYLGDAVLGLIVAELLMELFPDAAEGKLSKWRSSLVSRRSLTEFAQSIRLNEFLHLGKGERNTGGATKSSILASGLEAVIGAMYLDGGMQPVRNFVGRLIGPFTEILLQDQEGTLPYQDAKTLLQETTQRLYKNAPLYRLVEAWGPEHEKFFKIEIVVQGEVIAHAEGRSKKEAEQQAARLALNTLGERSGK